jgi:hypothetical protein
MSVFCVLYSKDKEETKSQDNQEKETSTEKL